MYDMGEFRGYRVIAASEHEYDDSCKQDYDKFYSVNGLLYFFGYPLAAVTRDGRVRHFYEAQYDQINDKIAQYKMTREKYSRDVDLASGKGSVVSRPQRSESLEYEPTETGDRRADEFMASWRDWIDQRLEKLKGFENNGAMG